MSGGHRSFTSPAAREPLTFDIDGERFTALASPPGTLLLQIARDVTEKQVVDILGFLASVMTLSEHERFRAFVDDPAKAIPVQVLVDLVEWLAGEYAGRPFVVPSPSPAGPTSAGPGSEDG